MFSAKFEFDILPGELHQRSRMHGEVFNENSYSSKRSEKSSNFRQATANRPVDDFLNTRLVRDSSFVGAPMANDNGGFDTYE